MYENDMPSTFILNKFSYGLYYNSIRGLGGICGSISQFFSLFAGFGAGKGSRFSYANSAGDEIMF